MPERSDRPRTGSGDFNPCNAAFVPPPPEMVPELLDDLCRFCSDDALPAVAQAALAHAQFETIHPFADGNGRTGRALIHVVLRRRGLTPRLVVPVSLILATWSQSYIAGLTATRYEGDAGSVPAKEGLNHWIALFASACTRAAEDATQFEARTRELEERWRTRLGTVRSGSALDLLLRKLPGAPLLTVKSASELLDRSFPAINKAITRLVNADILRQVKVGRRNRAFEAPEVVEAFTALERGLASPEGDTRIAPPVRRVPRHPESRLGC